jgi:S-adenosylmethionine decarboxylase
MSDTIDPLDMRLYAMDVWVSDEAVLVDRERIAATLYAAAEAGRATVLGEKFCTFPNGAVTGVLILAQSHLSIHTWPELGLANLDLLSYGALDGDEVMKVVEKGLGASRSQLTCIPRAGSA